MSTPAFTDVPLPIPGSGQSPADLEQLEARWRQLSRPLQMTPVERSEEFTDG